MKKIFIAASLVAWGMAFSQIQVESKIKGDSNTQGIFVKDGTQKLSSLDCYNFKDLIVSFDIDPSFFNYDQILVVLSRGTSQGDGFHYTYSFTREDFSRRFKGKKYAYLSLFPEEGLDKKSVMNFRRVELQMVGSKKEMETSMLFVVIEGGMKTGETETVFRGDQIIKNDKYKYERLTALSPIPMHNLFKEPSWGQYPTMPKGEGACYE